MLGCPSPKKSFKSSDNAHHIFGDLGEVSSVVSWEKARKVFKHGWKSPWVVTLTRPFPNGQADAGSRLGSKNALYYCAQSANSKDYSGMFSWFLIRRLLSRHTCPVRLTKVVHARETVIFFFPNQKRRNFRWFEKTFRIYGFNTTNLRSEFRHFLLRMFQCYFLWEKKIFSGKMLTKTLEYC